MTGFGSMITFETGSLSNAKKMLKKSAAYARGRVLAESKVDLSSRHHDHAAWEKEEDGEIGSPMAWFVISVESKTSKTSR